MKSWFKKFGFSESSSYPTLLIRRPLKEISVDSEMKESYGHWINTDGTSISVECSYGVSHEKVAIEIIKELFSKNKISENTWPMT